MQILIKPHSAVAGVMMMFQYLSNHHKKKIKFLVIFLITGIVSFAQRIDTLPGSKVITNRYDSATKAHPPRAATFRSAVIPGWGQVYNKKYWKVPIIYAALGITGYIFIDNIKTYKEYRFAYAARVKAQQPPPAQDSTDYYKLKELYKVISPESIQAARNRFRQYVDYSALFFILFWGLNIVDATVDAHLKSFDVSPDLSLQIKAGHSQMAGTDGISLVLSFRENQNSKVKSKK